LRALVALATIQGLFDKGHAQDAAQNHMQITLTDIFMAREKARAALVGEQTDRPALPAGADGAG
jgi:hypothetical protein